MRSNPLVSVIIPAYNASASLHESIASALEQSLQNIEIIVVDDGSTDATAEIVRGVAARDQRVRLIQQANRGVAAARNRAIEASRGEYIAPLDADDRWSPHKLEEQVARFRAGSRRMGMVYSWWAGIDEAGEATGVSQSWAMEGSLYGVLLFANFIGNASVPLFRREALDAVGLYDESFRARDGEGCEDWDLSLRISEHYEVGLAPAFHIAYRDSQTSMSKKCKQMARSFELVWEAAHERSSRIPDRIYRWSKGAFWLYLASQAFEVGQYSGARKLLIKAALADPVGAVGRLYWQRLWTTIVTPDGALVPRSKRTDQALSLAALGAPEQLEPDPDAWWKIYARVRHRRALWAARWSRTFAKTVVHHRPRMRRYSTLRSRTA